MASVAELKKTVKGLIMNVIWATGGGAINIVFERMAAWSAASPTATC